MALFFLHGKTATVYCFQGARSARGCGIDGAPWNTQGVGMEQPHSRQMWKVWTPPNMRWTWWIFFPGSTLFGIFLGGYWKKGFYLWRHFMAIILMDISWITSSTGRPTKKTRHDSKDLQWVLPQKWIQTSALLTFPRDVNGNNTSKTYGLGRCFQMLIDPGWKNDLWTSFKQNP